MTLWEHLSWEEHIRNSHLLIPGDAVHNSSQSMERQLPESWHNLKPDKTTKAIKQNSNTFSYTYRNPSKHIIKFIRKIFLLVSANASAYGETEKLNHHTGFMLAI